MLKRTSNVLIVFGVISLLFSMCSMLSISLYVGDTVNLTGIIIWFVVSIAMFVLGGILAYIAGETK